MLNASGVKIWRPRQLYMGPSEREYVDVERRQGDSGSAAFAKPAQVDHGGDSNRNKLATFKDAKGNLIKPKL
jgi:citrate synthase